MPARCEICDKKRMVGNTVSHANNRRKTLNYPNVQRVHAVVDGVPQRVNVCTRCIKSGRVTKG
ncbi:MAG: 50S ribosomal protein L28 [Myxococcota bacterium]